MAASCRSAADSVLYVRSPGALQRLALSYDSILADVYWIRAVQHVRRHQAGPDGRSQLRAAVSAARPDHLARSALRRRLSVRRALPRRAAARRAGPPRSGDRAAARSGSRRSPTTGSSYQAIGFVHYWSHQDYATAADWFDRAAKLPEAPTWMAALAAVTLAEGGNREASRQLWQQILTDRQRRLVPARGRSAPEAARRDGSDRAAPERSSMPSRPGTGARPRTGPSWRARGYVRGAIVDPDGAPYRLDGSGR